MLIDLAAYARTLDDKLYRTPSPLSATSRASSLPTSHEASYEDTQSCDSRNDMEYLATRIHGLSLDSSGVSKFNQVKLLQTALDIRDEMYGADTNAIVLQKRPEFWEQAPVGCSLVRSSYIYRSLCFFSGLPTKNRRSSFQKRTFYETLFLFTSRDCITFILSSTSPRSKYMCSKRSYI